MQPKIAIELIVEIVAGVYLTAVVVFLWEYPVTATLLLAVGIGLWVLKYRNKADVVVMLAAALLGTPTITRSIAMVYTVIILVAAVFWHKDRDILIFIVGATLGTIGEAICMKVGFWHYHSPYFKAVGMPISLPMAWGLSAVIIGRIAKNWEA